MQVDRPHPQGGTFQYHKFCADLLDGFTPDRDGDHSICAICGEAGRLTPCDKRKDVRKCPLAFHEACLINYPEDYGGVQLKEYVPPPSREPWPPVFLKSRHGMAGPSSPHGLPPVTPPLWLPSSTLRGEPLSHGALMGQRTHPHPPLPPPCPYALPRPQPRLWPSRHPLPPPCS